MMNKFYAQFLKRFFDFCISFVAIMCLSPILLFVTVWLHFINKGSGAFFFQERPGMGGKIFRIIKFKSMTDECDKNGNLLPNIMRLTKAGKFIRKTSIDELPQLFNILKGDMSLIGPRPLLIEYFPYYTEREQLRHVVRPGVTGYAQVNGRNNLNWDDRLELDAYYFENLSIWIDLKIVIMTIKNVIIRKDIKIVTGNGVNGRFNLDVERKIKY